MLAERSAVSGIVVACAIRPVSNARRKFAKETTDDFNPDPISTGIVRAAISASAKHRRCWSTSRAAAITRDGPRV
jgi:hypothetical protein